MHNRTLNALIRKRLEVTQEENSAITYTVNWAPFLDTATVSTSTWTTEDSGLTVANKANNTTEASARFSGDPGHYRAVNQIVDSAGDTHERYLDIYIRDNTSGYQFDYGLVQAPRY